MTKQCQVFFQHTKENLSSSVYSPVLPQKTTMCYSFQILSLLEIILPLNILLDMFKKGVASLANPPPVDLEAEEAEAAEPIKSTVAAAAAPMCAPDSFSAGSPLTPSHHPTTFADTLEEDTELNLACFIMMLDLLNKQVRKY